jgi:hypothetical protein
MTYTQARIIQNLLIAEGLGVAASASISTDWRTFRNSMPADGDQVITVFDTGGILDGRAMRGGAYTEHFGIMVQVRARDEGVGGKKIQDIEDFLCENATNVAITIGTGVGAKNYKIHAVQRTSPMVNLGQEEKNKRFMFSANFTATIEEL